MTWANRPILNFSQDHPCAIARLSMWMYQHGRITNTVSFLLFLIAFGLLLAR